MVSPIMTVGGKPLTIAGKLALLFASAAAAAPTQPAGPMPESGLSGWWDSSSLAPSTGITTLADKSSAGVTANTGGVAASLVPHVAGLLPGLYVEGVPYAAPYNYGYVHPIVSDYAINAANVKVGAGGAFTVFLAWSRANLRQPGAVTSNAAVTLLSIGGTPVLGMTANGDGTDVLKLFPSGAAVAGGVLELRHTHSARVVFSGSTVDVWLDGTKVISGAANSLSLGATASMSLLNAAGCIFHEAAAWGHTLSSSEHAALTAYAVRWPLGPRRALFGVVMGQSNASKMIDLSSNHIVAKRVAYLTGSLSANLFARSGSNGNITAGATIWSGSVLYTTNEPGTFLDSTTGAGNVSAWPLGGQGLQFKAAIDSLTADQRANLHYVAFFWSESMGAGLSYANKATCLAAHKRAFALIRSTIGKSAAELPVLLIDPLPSGNDAGQQTLREVFADLVADVSQNCAFMLAQAGDAVGENDPWDAATGLESGPGNGSHRDANGEVRYARRFAIPVARAALAASIAAGKSDPVMAVDPSIPQTGGPKIATAQYEGGTSVLVTVLHDGGTDLAVPLRAALGVGWELMDGVSDSVAGTPGAPGTRIKATACTRVSATQLRLTLASVPAHPAKAKLYYNYGSSLDASVYAVIGEGNAVTDNFASITLPAGWRIGADLGVNDQPNNPLQATTYGIPLS